MRYRLLFHPITTIALLGIAGPSALGARGSTQALARAVGPGVISTPEGESYSARRRGDMMVVEGLGPNINTAHSEPDVFVDPAQRFIILARTDDPSGAGGDDLYISTRASGGDWSTPRNLGSAVNTAEFEYGPLVSADGSTLYFTSHRGGQANLYEIPAHAVGIGGAN